MSPTRSHPCSLSRVLAWFAVLLCWPTLGLAGISYQLAPHPEGGVVIKGVLFNDTSDILHVTPESQLLLTWQDAQGKLAQGVAQLVSSPDPISLPVNNFVALAWQTQPPTHLDGLLSLQVPGQDSLLAWASPHPSLTLAAAGHATSPAPAPGRPAVTNLGSPPPPRQHTHDAFENFRNAISTHDPVYFSVGSAEGTHARFQVSFKYQLFRPDTTDHPRFIDHLYLGYTQTSLWDLEGHSKPFIDTTYNPSVFWKQDKLLAWQQERWHLGLAAGLEHQSNGKSGADSRSLNNVFVQPELHYRLGGGSTLSLAPRIKSYFSTKDNTDYADYAGRVDWRLRWAQDNGLTLSSQYRQGKHGRNAVQLDATWPLRRTFLNMNGYLHVQYFKGYGDTLLGYNRHSGSRVRVGLALVP